ncbi:YbjN domain-containing protein [Methanofollis fontis]|nr:YbjN domain-containing protein [Methanofollis fontis]
MKFFRDDDWKFDKIEGKSSLKMGVNTDVGRYQLIAHANEKVSCLMIYCIPGTRVPADKRGAIAEYLTRANYGLRIGNFEMDFDDGEIRYKTSIDVEGTVDSLSHNVIKWMVIHNLNTMDRYLPGVMRIIYSENGDIDVKRVLQSIEN